MTVSIPAITLVAPAPGVVRLANFRNLDNWRALIHQITPVVVTVLTTLSITTNDQAALWVSLLFAVVDPLLSVRNAADKTRQVVYGVLGLLQSGGLLAAVLAPTPIAVPVAAAVITIITSTLSRFYTPTTTMIPAPTRPAVTPSVVPANNPWPA